MSNFYEEIKNDPNVAELIYKIMRADTKLNIKRLAKAKLEDQPEEIINHLKSECMRSVDFMDKAINHYLKTKDTSFNQ